jgi:hypothetical protein
MEMQNPRIAKTSLKHLYILQKDLYGIHKEHKNSIRRQITQ